MEESAKESKKLNSLPLPHTCFTVKPQTAKFGTNANGVSKLIATVFTIRFNSILSQQVIIKYYQ